jgi:hypothetical protein
MEMKRLQIVMRGGAVIEADVSDEWNLDTNLLKFPPPDDLWQERLRYLSTDDVVAIVELREPPELSVD